MSSSFSQLGLYPWLLKQCEYMMIHEPREIQRRCIPAIFAGQHIAAGAPTGSGKTAAFALPLLQILSDDMYGVFALILTASRELAYQIQDQFVALGAPVRLRTTLIIGGVRHEEQLDAIQTRPHVMIATPGRLVHLLTHFAREVAPAMRRIRFLVLDEADRLIDGDMQKDVRVLLEHLPSHPQRRVLMFSATLTPPLTRVGATATSATAQGSTASDIHSAATSTTTAIGSATSQKRQKGMMSAKREEDETNWTALMGITDPDTLSVFRVSDEVAHSSLHRIVDGSATDVESANGSRGDDGSERDGPNPVPPVTPLTHSFPASLEQRYLFIPDMVKLPTLVAILRARGKDQSTLVFTNSCVRVELVRLTLQLLGFPVCSLNGLLTQQHRLDNLARFKLGLAKVMVCTDVASRGLDIPAVSLVVHYDLPKHAVTYVHRVGRTARATRIGCSLALLSEYDVRLVQRLERALRIRLTASRDAAALEGAVVGLLDEVSEAKIQARQQVTEQFGTRAMTRKGQRAEKHVEAGGTRQRTPPHEAQQHTNGRKRDVEAERRAGESRHGTMVTESGDDAAAKRPRRETGREAPTTGKEKPRRAAGVRARKAAEKRNGVRAVKNRLSRQGSQCGQTDDACNKLL